VHSASFALLAAALVGTACSSGSESSDRERTATTAAPTTPRPTPGADVVVPAATAEVVATTDERFQSFNLEMASVLGGTFWAPFDDPSGEAMSAHPPIELDERLVNLTKRLSPNYLRVSGSWANQIYFDDSEDPRTEPPDGFKAVLTAERWEEVNRFAADLGNRIVTSFSVSPGTRDADGRWTTEQAERFLRFTVDHDLPVDAAEFINEPNVQATTGGQYTAEGFARDFRTLMELRDRVAPKLRLLGPGAAEPAHDMPKAVDDPNSEQLLGATGDLFDGYSYHFYSGMSSRCPGLPQIPVDRLMEREVLAIPLRGIQRSKELRDRYLPGKEIWLTETATAACGGDPTASKFEGAFAYLEHLADAAKGGIWVSMHNTLVGSDYGLIDDRTHEPRPSYWAAVLWKKLMGPKVLDVAPATANDKVSVYGHCVTGADEGSVAVLVNNRDPARGYTLDLGSERADVYTLTALDPGATAVELNGQTLPVTVDGTFPEPRPVRASGRALAVPPTSITFVTLPDAHSTACS